MKHKLIIKSQHDGQAECACGKWYYCITDKLDIKTVKKEYLKHLK